MLISKHTLSDILFQQWNNVLSQQCVAYAYAYA